MKTGSLRASVIKAYFSFSALAAYSSFSFSAALAKRPLRLGFFGWVTSLTDSSSACWDAYSSYSYWLNFFEYLPMNPNGSSCWVWVSCWVDSGAGFGFYTTFGASTFACLAFKTESIALW